MWLTGLAIFILVWICDEHVAADVRASKANSYTVLAPPDGVSTSKANSYIILAPPNGVSASKANSYVILAPPEGGPVVTKANGYVVLTPPSNGISASKANGYVVLTPPSAMISTSKALAYAVLSPKRRQPNVYIMSKRYPGLWQLLSPLTRPRSSPDFSSEFACMEPDQI